MLMRSPTRWARPKLVRPPRFILPCQPVLATKVPVGEGWLHELKHDGFRIIAHKDGERVHLLCTDLELVQQMRVGDSNQTADSRPSKLNRCVPIELARTA